MAICHGRVTSQTIAILRLFETPNVSKHWHITAYTYTNASSQSNELHISTARSLYLNIDHDRRRRLAAVSTQPAFSGQHPSIFEIHFGLAFDAFRPAFLSSSLLEKARCSFGPEHSRTGKSRSKIRYHLWCINITISERYKLG